MSGMNELDLLYKSLLAIRINCPVHFLQVSSMYVRMFYAVDQDLSNSCLTYTRCDAFQHEDFCIFLLKLSLEKYHVRLYSNFGAADPIDMHLLHIVKFPFALTHDNIRRISFQYNTKIFLDLYLL